MKELVVVEKFRYRCTKTTVDGILLDRNNILEARGETNKQVGIQRLDVTRVRDSNGNSIHCKIFCCFQSIIDNGADSKDRNIAAIAEHLSLTDRKRAETFRRERHA